MSHPLYVLAVLCLIVFASEWLVRRTALRHLGTALTVIVMTAVAANLGVIPAGSSAEAPVPVYDGIFAFVAPLAIFWLLLGVNLREVLRAGVPMLVLFLVGCVGAVAGGVLGIWLIDGPSSIGPLFAAIGGMFVGTYTGGSINFNAVAIAYDVMREGLLFAGAVAVDNIVGMAWMAATLVLPRALAPLWRGVGPTRADRPRLSPEEIAGHDTEPLHPADLGLVIGLGAAVVWVSELLSGVAASRLGWNVPSILVLTVIALLLAQLPTIARLRGPRAIGLFAVYLFLAVIGAFCDLARLAELGSLGGALLVLASSVVLLHGLFTFAAARLLRIDLDVAAVSSQACVGGGTSALAVARSLDRPDLVLPGILAGSLGNAVGTFLGLWAAAQLLPPFG